MKLKIAGLWAAGAAVAAGITFGVTHWASTRDDGQIPDIGPTVVGVISPPNFTPIAPADGSKAPGRASAEPPNFTPIAPADGSKAALHD